jgi:hypothetical protein
MFRNGSLVTALGGLLALTFVTSCGKRNAGEHAGWLDEPTGAQKRGEKLYFPELDVTFQKPDTLYVFKNCSEANHSPEGEAGWIPVVTCAAVVDGEEYAEGAPEAISLTIYATKKTRPLDERTVSWFENQFKQAGFSVDDLSYQHDYQNKSGIYAKLQLMDKSTGTPTREILQFMFPKQDIVFVARTEYPYGDSRAIANDWKYLLWNFEIFPKKEE